MVMPVKDNLAGVSRFLQGLWDSTSSDDYTGLPAELIIVDNNSTRALRLPLIAHAHPDRISMRVIRCSTPGPAAARNAGVAVSTKAWIQFVDSDCIPQHGFVSGFGAAMDGSVAYAGAVRALGNDALSRYYETQCILEPPRDDVGRPRYLVTANALVWRAAFERVGGFRESFKLAAGEDVDLALRLREVGTLAYAPKAIVLHDFEPALVAFWERFERYGAGNRQVEGLHDLDLMPRPFAPIRQSAFNWVAASLQYLAMAKGYAGGGRPQP
jgi:GT2 family glycosyltransferase